MRVPVAISAALLGSVLSALPGCAGTGQGVIDALDQIGSVVQGGGLSQSEILAGLRDALQQGTTSAISQLGRNDGFWRDPQVRVPLPSFVARYESAVRSVGYGSTLDQFQLSLNRAAEQAVPQAMNIIGNAISRMTIDDAKEILDGPSNAATEFFRRSSSDDLYQSILPIVTTTTEQAGVTQQYKKLASKAGPILRLSGSSMPADLDGYVTQKALDGLFLKIAEEEARIRADPAARSTELLKKVFAKQHH
ncbi:MAG: hypothetical protein JWQ90_5408 [Hydrocarboniphaga sp.]|uniref:DUF4197 domain-containing protein n=1 Tax=Hydrocarboniphaga sp. TaxID=2033016 RepID=UPI00261AE103|nr:DUF4197 domain-containing protein [Hydrocarboniphaga sp.]MDB5972958.1 hypothetical protein [Hydrocarboniphaga sp.]